MSQTIGQCALLILLLSSTAVQVDTDKPGPEIFSLNPNEGAAGQEIDLKGSALGETKHIYFCVGQNIREAKFKIVSANQLQVIAPTFLRPGASATVVVQTSAGVTVGMPASALRIENVTNNQGTSTTFFDVIQNGQLKSPTGTVFIEEGGSADTPSGSGFCFVKNGGSILDIDRFRGMLFYEPLAKPQIPEWRKSGYPIIPVVADQVTTSVGIEPFIYDRPEPPEAMAQSAPKVTAATPQQLTPGAIITLHGHGFFETSKVLAIDHHSTGQISAADFRIVSDHELEVELPDSTYGTPLLVVMNPKGATVVVSSSQTVNSIRNVPLLTPLTVVASGVMLTMGPARNCFVERGATFPDIGNSRVLFVKKGGHVRLHSPDSRQIIFCENEKDIEKDYISKEEGAVIHEVASLSLSIISKPIEIRWR